MRLIGTLFGVKIYADTSNDKTFEKVALFLDHKLKNRLQTEEQLNAEIDRITKDFDIK